LVQRRIEYPSHLPATVLAFDIEDDLHNVFGVLLLLARLLPLGLQAQGTIERVRVVAGHDPSRGG
jgi:hypothetical protein